MRLDLNLSSQLILDLVLLNLLFVQDFQRHNIFRIFLTSEVDVAEFTSGQGLGDFEAIDVPNVWIKLFLSIY